MDEVLKLATPENILGALALLGLIDVRRVLARLERRDRRIEARVKILEDHCGITAAKPAKG